MSSVSGIGGTSLETLQSLRQMMEQDAASGVNRAGQSPPNGDTPPLWEDIEESASTAGLSDEEIDSLRADLKEAIATAMESAGQTEDPQAAHEAIDDAILTTLQEYGVDTSEVESRMEEAKAHMQGGPPPGPPPDGAGAAGSTSALSSLTANADSELSSLLSAIFPLVDEEA